MSEFHSLLRRIAQDIVSEVRVAMICRVESFDQAKLTATIQPLGKVRADNRDYDLPTLPDVPIATIYGGGFWVRPQFEKGDLVVCLFSAHELTGAIKGQATRLSASTHELSYAVIVAGIPNQIATEPKWGTESGFLIGHTSGDPLLKMDEGKITAKTTEFFVDAQTVKLGPIADLEKSVLGETFLGKLKSLIDVISNITTAGGPAAQAVDAASKTALAAEKAALDSILSEKVKSA